MEFTKEMITWILVVIGTNLSAVVIAILSWIRAAKMMPKELKASDLDNMGREASVADQFNDIAIKAAEQAVSLQDKLLKIEDNYNLLKCEYDELKQKVASQEKTIQEQIKIIEQNNIRLNEQEARMAEQDEIIDELKFDLNLAHQYNLELIAQMKAKNLTPIDPPKRKYTRRQKPEIE